MSFCIRNAFNRVNINWVKQAREGLESIDAITEIFNDKQNLGSSKKAIVSMSFLGMSEKAQKYMFMATDVSRKEHFGSVISKARAAQESYVNECNALFREELKGNFRG